MTIRLVIGGDIQRAAHGDIRLAAAERYLATLPAQGVWIWSDGSAEGGLTAGGGGALITLPYGEEREVRTKAGAVCSSTRAELAAILAALEELRGLGAALEPGGRVSCPLHGFLGCARHARNSVFTF